MMSYLIKTIQVLQIISIVTLACGFSPERISSQNHNQNQSQSQFVAKSQKIELGNVIEFDCDNPYVKTLLLKATGRCFPENYADACPPLMVVSQVLLQNSTEKEGKCACKSFYFPSSCGERPIAFFEKERRCYFLFQQGPCKNGEWLEANEQGEATCKVNPCQGNKNDEIPDEWTQCEEIKEEKVKSQFNFSHSGNCYQTKTQAFCPEGQEVGFPPRGVYPICRNSSEWNCPACEYCGCGSVSQSAVLNCPRGMKRDVSGICLPVVEFDY